jgi:hypothetical protein
MKETQSHGFDYLMQQQILLGSKVRALMVSKGFPQRGRCRLSGTMRGRQLHH